MPGGYYKFTTKVRFTTKHIVLHNGMASQWKKGVSPQLNGIMKVKECVPITFHFNIDT